MDCFYVKIDNVDKVMKPVAGSRPDKLPVRAFYDKIYPFMEPPSARGLDNLFLPCAILSISYPQSEIHTFQNHRQNPT
jgi:hypothetical protein